MNVVVVDWDVSFPMNSGKRLRTLNLMLQLADRHEITYISRGNESSSECRLAQEFLNDHQIRTLFTNDPIPSKEGWGFFLRLGRNLLNEKPYAVNVHKSTLFASKLKSYARQNVVDLWQFEWSPYLDMLRGISPFRSLIVAHNVDTLIWQRYYETETNLFRRWFIKNQWQKFETFERKTFNQADGVIAVSDADASILRQQFGVKQVDVVENGVDVSSYQEVSSKRNRNELLFIGSLDWRPNQDAVRRLLKEIFPHVRREIPEAKLSIVGRNPPNWLVEEAKRSHGVDLSRNVPDVRPFLARAGIMVVPLRIGGGSRLKILEALANGLPVVATSVAAEGLRLTPNVDYGLAENSKAFSEALVDWIRHPDLAQQLTKNGQMVVSQRYGWDQQAERLESIWEKTAQLQSLLLST